MLLFACSLLRLFSMRATAENRPLTNSECPVYSNLPKLHKNNSFVSGLWLEIEMFVATCAYVERFRVSAINLTEACARTSEKAHMRNLLS